MEIEQVVFKTILSKSKLSQTDFANLVGTSEAHISNLKHGKMQAKLSTLEHFCEKVGLSMEISILDGNND